MQIPYLHEKLDLHVVLGRLLLEVLAERVVTLRGVAQLDARHLGPLVDVLKYKLLVNATQLHSYTGKQIEHLFSVCCLLQLTFDLLSTLRSPYDMMNYNSKNFFNLFSITSIIRINSPPFDV